jgi:hypothetical protein
MSKQQSNIFQNYLDSDEAPKMHYDLRATGIQEDYCANLKSIRADLRNLPIFCNLIANSPNIETAASITESLLKLNIKNDLFLLIALESVLYVANTGILLCKNTYGKESEILGKIKSEKEKFSKERSKILKSLEIRDLKVFLRIFREVESIELCRQIYNTSFGILETAEERFQITFNLYLKFINLKFDHEVDETLGDSEVSELVDYYFRQSLYILNQIPSRKVLKFIGELIQKAPSYKNAKEVYDWAISLANSNNASVIKTLAASLSFPLDNEINRIQEKIESNGGDIESEYYLDDLLEEKRKIDEEIKGMH